jgi:hypothetical protein
VQKGVEKSPGISPFWRMGFVLFLIVLGLAGLNAKIATFDLFSLAAIVIGGYPLVRHAAQDLLQKNITPRSLWPSGSPLQRR